MFSIMLLVKMQYNLSNHMTTHSSSIQDRLFAATLHRNINGRNRLELTYPWYIEPYVCQRIFKK